MEVVFMVCLCHPLSFHSLSLSGASAWLLLTKKYFFEMEVVSIVMVFCIILCIIVWEHFVSEIFTCTSFVSNFSANGWCTKIFHKALCAVLGCLIFVCNHPCKNISPPKIFQITMLVSYRSFSWWRLACDYSVDFPTSFHAHGMIYWARPISSCSLNVGVANRNIRRKWWNRWERV